MSLEILTSTTAGGSLDAPAAFSSTTAEGAGNGVPFAALLDEQAGADEDLCPQIVDEPAELGCERMAETTRMASGSSLSALGFGIPDSSDIPAPAAPADDDDEAGDEARLDIVLLAGMPTLVDLLVKAEEDAGGEAASGETPVAEPHGDSLAASIAAESALAGTVADADIVQIAEGEEKTTLGADPDVAPDITDAVTKAAASQVAKADAGQPPAVREDLRQLVQAALRARVAEAYRQPAGASAALPQDAPVAVAQDATTVPSLPQGQPTSDLAARARAIVAEAAGSSAGNAANTDTPPDPDTGGGRQPLMSPSDHEMLLGARSVPVAPSIAPFDSVLASAATPQAATGVATIPNEAHVASSIVQSMRLQMRDGVGTAVVHLEPDYLGPVTINLRVSGGAVTASLHAENPQVRAWIEANEPMLRQALSDQGLSLDRLLVTAERAAEDQEAGSGGQQPHDQPPPRRQPKPDASRFEVIV